MSGTVQCKAHRPYATALSGQGLTFKLRMNIKRRVTLAAPALDMMGDMVNNSNDSSASRSTNHDSDVCVDTRAVETRAVLRSIPGEPVSVQTDVVAAEVPVALVFNGISHAVMMATPQDLPALALGFALSEGILSAPDECYGIEVRSLDAQQMTGGLVAAYEVQIDIASRRFATFKERRRTLAGRTGCGVCGVESLDAFELQVPKVSQPLWMPAITQPVLAQAFAELHAMQPINQQSGSLHAAGWVCPDGTLARVMEDVGRHNALDKLLGWRAAHSDVPLSGFVVMTSRASYELVRKCAFLDVPMLATISAPTSLAVTLAQSAGMQLYGWCRGASSVRYTP